MADNNNFTDKEIIEFLHEEKIEKEDGEIFEAEERRVRIVDLDELFEQISEYDVPLPSLLENAADVESAFDAQEFALASGEIDTTHLNLFLSLNDLQNARGFARYRSGFNDVMAIEARDKSLANVMWLEEYSDEQKMSFIKLTNGYLSEYVEPFELPEAINPNAMQYVFKDFSEAIFILSNERSEQSDIFSDVMKETKENLRELTGEHDDFDSFSATVFLMAYKISVELHNLPQLKDKSEARNKIRNTLKRTYEFSKDVGIAIDDHEIDKVIYQTYESLVAKGYKLPLRTVEE